MYDENFGFYLTSPLTTAPGLAYLFETVLKMYKAGKKKKNSVVVQGKGHGDKKTVTIGVISSVDVCGRFNVYIEREFFFH